MDSIEQLIGRRLKEARINAGYTQNDLAEKSRLSISTISRIENGHMLCGIETLLGLCSLLDVGIDFLLMDFIDIASLSLSFSAFLFQFLYFLFCILTRQHIQISSMLTLRFVINKSY